MALIEQLQSHFGGGGVDFAEGGGGLAKINVQNEQAAGEVYLHGATVTHFQPEGHEPVLFVSQQSVFRADRAIRGGIPICWPWFGPKPGDPSAPQHGLVRTKMWMVSAVRRPDPGTTEIDLSTAVDGAAVLYTVIFAQTLTARLQTINTAESPLVIEEALHSYFRVGDSRQVSISGLAGTTYIDKMAGGGRKLQPIDPIRFTMETDRVYLDTGATCVLNDPVLGRRISVAKRGSQSTVVWNPWIEKSRALADFGDDEWQRMCCIETANAFDDRVTVPAGQGHTIETVISIARQ